MFKIVLKVVVLPAPFGPSNPKIFPGITENERLSTAKVELNLLTRFLTIIEGYILKIVKIAAS